MTLIANLHVVPTLELQMLESAQLPLHQLRMERLGVDLLIQTPLLLLLLLQLR